MAAKKVTAKQILDKALELAEKRSWEAVRLHDVADGLGVSLKEVSQFYREKEDLVDAWLDTADQAMLSEAKKADFSKHKTRVQLQKLIMVWLHTLAAHQRVTRQMIYGKMEFGHLHVHIPALLRVSRTVQWMREATHRDATYAVRAMEEVGLTTIFLAALARWMHDHSEHQIKTDSFLRERLREAEGLKKWMS